MVVVAATAGVAGAPIAATTAGFFGGGTAAAGTAAGTAGATAAGATAASAATAGATAGASTLAGGAVASGVAAGELTAAGAAGSYAAIGTAAVVNPVGLIVGVALLGATVTGDHASHDAPRKHSEDEVDVKTPQTEEDLIQPRLVRQESFQELLDSGAVSADCWKPLLHDSSETPSRGMIMRDVLEHPCIRSVDVCDACLVLTNVWEEAFRLELVQLPGPGRKFAYHASAMEKTLL